MQLLELKTIDKDGATYVKNLNPAQLTELQTALVKLGYPAGKIDGKYGPRTRNAWAEFIDASGLDNEPNSVDTNSINTLQQCLDDLIPAQVNNFTNKKGTIEAIKSECLRQGIGLKPQIAYVLATVDHETNHTFKPVTEAYWLPDPDTYLREHHPAYYPFYGRGYVQLTWENNYATYGRLLGKDLVNHPELALEPEIALFVLVHGFKTGSFTGRKISDFINTDKTDFIKARYCINGNDRADLIARLAKSYLQSLG